MTKHLLKSRMQTCWFVSLLFLIGLVAAAQNAIVGSGFSSGWGGGSCPTGSGNFSYFSEIYNGTYGTTRTPNGIGDQYWRFGIDWSGTTAQRTITVGSDVTVSPNTTYTLSSTCTTNGALRYNVPSTSYRYVFKTLNAGTSPTGQFVFFEIQGTVRSVSSVSSSPSAIAANSPVTITAQLDAPFANGQAAYIRYSTNNFASTKVVAMTGSGTTYTGTIPGTDNAGGSTVRYYIFTSGTANVAANGSNADLYTINFNNNGGSNYSYYVYGTPATPSAISGSASVCENTSQIYSVTADPNIVSYNWTLPSGWTGSSTTNSINVTTGSAGGTISVTGTNPNGTSSASTKAITLTQTVAILSESLGGQTACAGGSLSALSITTAGASSYQWYRNTTASNSGGTAVSGATSSSFTPSAGILGTSYYYCVASGSCGAVTSVASSVSGAIVVNGLANDSASHSAYSGGFSGGLNGGAGFGPWTISTTGTVSGVFKGSSDIGTAWGFYANSGSTVTATRSFTQPLAIGQTISLSMDNGFIDNGKQVGFRLYNSSNAMLTSFYFTGGQSNYFIQTAGGATNTNVPYTSTGLSVTIAYTGANTFSLFVTKVGVTTVLQNLTFITSGQPTQIQFYNNDAGSGGSYDAFFNDLRIGYPAIFVQPSAVAQPSVCQNATATPLSVTAYGDSLTYQWYSNSSASNVGGTAISGAQFNTFSPPTNIVGTMFYYCVVGYGGNGSCVNWVTSAVSGAITVIAPTTFYADADSDQYGNPNVTILACGNAPTGYVSNNLDCNDNDSTVFQSALLYIDADGDLFDNGTELKCFGDTVPAGYSDDTLGPDCDDAVVLYQDNDGDGFGSTVKVACGGVTNNLDCNDNQLQYADLDGDGFGSGTLVACGVTNNTDCNDAVTYYTDNDGDGFGVLPKLACGTVTNNLDCNDAVTYYTDNDGDGFGVLPKVACGTVTNNTDCDDGTIRYADNDNDGFGSTTMVACGGVTNSSDCDDNTVRYLDGDNDGYGSLVKVACGGVTNSTDCDDTKSTVNPGAAEIPYNLIDDDCDGLIDEGFPPKNTTITGPQCNTTLPSIDAQVIADVVAGAQGYQWRVTTLTGPNAGLVQFLNTPLRVMKLVQLSNFAYATTYKIEVAVYYAGYLQPYLASNCTVTTPAATTSLANCNQTIASMQDVIYANNVPYASGYKFRVTEVGASGNTQELVRSVREFRMNLITAFQPKFNKAYTVEVSVKNTNGLYLPYGSPCTVTTPLFPTTSIEDSQCEDFAPATTGTPIYAISYPGAISYVFNLTGPGLPAQGIEITRATRSFKLSDFTGLVPSATYSVRVRLIFNANDPAGPYGKVCTVIVPGASRIAKLPFEAKAYPNPFGDTFGIAVTGSSRKEIGVKLYDMTGRLLENRRVSVSELDALTIGANLPSGVYNVVVSQGDEVKTLRVIKR